MLQIHNINQSKKSNSSQPSKLNQIIQLQSNKISTSSPPSLNPQSLILQKVTIHHPNNPNGFKLFLHKRKHSKRVRVKTDSIQLQKGLKRRIHPKLCNKNPKSIPRLLKPKKSKCLQAAEPTTTSFTFARVAHP